MQRESSRADLVLLGLACPDEGKEEEYAERLAELTEGLPSCFLVHNGSLFIGELVSPQAEDEDEVVQSATENSLAADVAPEVESEPVDSVKMKAGVRDENPGSKG